MMVSPAVTALFLYQFFNPTIMAKKKAADWSYPVLRASQTFANLLLNKNRAAPGMAPPVAWVSSENF